jgi:Haloacid dehalogenase-like hydrolase
MYMLLHHVMLLQQQQQLRAAGKRIFFVTNNSTKSRKGYKKKFDELGLDVQPEEVTFFVCAERSWHVQHTLLLICML